MKTLILWLTLVVFTLSTASFAFTSGFYKGFLIRSVCDRKITYKIGFVDNRFGLSEEEFLTDIEKAAGIWYQTYGKPLFITDPGGELTLSMVFDERQSLSNKIDTLEGQLNVGRDTLDNQVIQYENQAQEFKKKLTNLNQRIIYWNSRGGAPPEEYAKLAKEQEALKLEADQLNATARSLNRSTEQYNVQVDQIEEAVDSFNSQITERPEEGIYFAKDNKIEIYFNINDKELIHTIAHELGHSIGMEHVSNKQAIMYQNANDVVVPSDEDILQLNQVCSKRTWLNFQSLRSN